MKNSTKSFQRRRNIERATLFKVEYHCYLDKLKLDSREFNSVKALNQWADRNDNTIGILIARKLALIDDVWEPFTAIGKKTVTLTELKGIVRDLEMKK